VNQVFPIPPATGKSVWFLIGAVILLVGVCVILSWVAWSTRHSRAEVTPQGLKLVGDLWGRTIPHDAFLLDDARIVDLRGEPDLTPGKRTMGTGLGGFAAGWFRLRNGEKALIYLTDRTRVVYLPTNRGHSVMLSSDEPERLLAAMRDN
jgi:hypothetical protein